METDTHALGTIPLALLKLLASEEQDAFQADREYVDEHFDELLAEYPDQWVIVKDLTVLLVTSDEQEVLDAVKEHGQMVVVDYMRPRGFQRVVSSHG